MKMCTTTKLWRQEEEEGWGTPGGGAEPQGAEICILQTQLSSLSHLPANCHCPLVRVQKAKK
jgi:hypothetical protein